MGRPVMETRKMRTTTSSLGRKAANVVVMG